MILVDVEQRTPQWFAARAGVVTSSVVEKVFMGPTTAGHRGLMAEIANSILTGKPNTEGGYVSKWMARGTEMEADARAALAFERGYDIEEVGFALHGKIPRIGASPDGLVGMYVDHIDDEMLCINPPIGVVEIKCPSLSTHLLNVSGGCVPSEYLHQCRHLLWVTGAQWLDFASYHPDAFKQLFVVRLERAKAKLDEHEAAVLEFITKAENMAEQLKALAA